MAAMPDLLSVIPVPKREDARYCQARLRLLIETLPVTIWFNPVGVAIACAALWFGRSDFGDLPAWRMALAVGCQCVASASAAVAFRLYPTVSCESVSRVRRALVALQVMIGLAWGGVVWAVWIEGNAANNCFAVIIAVMALWAMALTRCAVRSVFFAGLASLAVPLCARFMTSSGVTAYVFLALLPIWMCYMLFSGLSARKRVDDMLAARFANEDLSRELAAAHDEAVQKREEAELANKSKTAFLANMSHELRTPLNAIIGFSEIIMSQALGVNNPRYPEYAGDIHTSGTHLLTLINEILDVAKIEAGRMEIAPRPLHVQSALESVERIIAIRASEKALTISYSVSPALDEIMADERAFRQIMLNLLSNAVKFTPQGGHIAVDCRVADDGGTLVSVTDDGPGIPADKIEQLFKPFTQVDNRFDHAQGGTGLGLALVHGLARLHGGRAWIESSEGHGTSAFVYFPLATVKRDLKRAM
ncbi:sensor histidine kinase [Rhizomicrobium electricum]|nr:two-component system cell cycle sensor histidine kinase PleC [Rhizomicrobium electricum]